MPRDLGCRSSRKNEFFKKKFKGTSKVDAQFMAVVAFATFATSSNLSYPSGQLHLFILPDFWIIMVRKAPSDVIREHAKLWVEKEVTGEAGDWSRGESNPHLRDATAS